MSGGSRMAYMMAELDDNVNGVVACGSGSSVFVKENPTSFHTAKLRKGTVVCSLLGTNDYNRREAVKSHLAHGKEARFIWFDGRHNWASPELLVEGVAHVYGTLLMKAKGLEVIPLRESFAARQLAWAKARQETHPGNTCHWAQFLSAIPGASQSGAKKLAADLAAKPEVQKELKAAKELDEFAEKFLGDGNTSGDMTANPAAQKAAAMQAAAFAGLPQEILFKKLGEPASK